MGENKRFAKNMTAKAFSLGLNLLISFFLTPFIIKHVGSEAYGFVGLANDFVDVARIASVALNSMALRFISISLHKGNEKEANQFFSSVIIVNFLMCLTLLVPFGGIVIFLDKLLEISGEILTDVRLLCSFVFLNFLVSVQGSSFSVALFTKNRIDKEALRSAESVGLRALFLLLCYALFPPKVCYVGISYCILTLYVFITNVYYTKKYLPNLSVSKKYFDKRAIKTLFVSGSWNCLTKIATILSTGLDLVLVNLFVGKTEMGVVSVSKAMPNTCLSVFVILAGVFLPQITEEYAKGNMKKIAENNVFSIKLLGILACIPIAMLGVFGDVFYKLWTPSENASLLWLLSSIGGAAFIFSLSTQSLWNIFTVTNRVKTSSVGLLTASCLSIATVFASMATVQNKDVRMFIIVGTSVFYNILITVFFLPTVAAKCIGFPKRTFYRPILKTVLLIFTVIALFFGIKALFDINSWVKLAAVFVAVSIVSSFLGIFIVLNKKERHRLINIVNPKTQSYHAVKENKK